MKSLLPKVVAAALLCLTVPAFADESEPDFKLINATGSAIDGVFISAPNANAFTKNELAAPLADAATIEVKYASAAKLCVLDAKITWNGGKNSEVAKAVDLCKIDKLTVKVDKATGKSSYTAE